MFMDTFYTVLYWELDLGWKALGVPSLTQQDWQGRFGSFLWSDWLYLLWSCFRCAHRQTSLDWYLMKDLHPPLRLHTTFCARRAKNVKMYIELLMIEVVMDMFMN
jgi:hypothetical protein